MARQTSMLQIEGTIGELCFYKTKDGYFVRRKSSLSKKRIKSDPAFARVRENNAEFARAARASALLRRAFKPLIHRASDMGVANRLTSIMMKVIREDNISRRGQRTVNHGQPELLEGFEFNEHRALSSVLHAQFSSSINPGTGKMVIDIAAFSPAQRLAAPNGATHFRFISGGAAIDFEGDNYDLARSESVCLPLDRKNTPRIRLIHNIKSQSAGPFFLLLGIEFLQVVNKKELPLGHEGNALVVVRVGSRRQ